MRDFRDAKAMARALRDALQAKALETTHAEALELIAKAFGFDNWNILSARIEAAGPPQAASEPLPAGAPHDDPATLETLYCSFCGKSQHEVRKLIAGPSAFICNECVDICTDVVEPDDDLELFRLMRANEQNGETAYPPWLDLARGMPTEELAHYVERSRKGVERNRAALQAFERNRRDSEVSADLATMQQKAQRELKRYEDALKIATTVLGERRQ